MSGRLFVAVAISVGVHSARCLAHLLRPSVRRVHTLNHLPRRQLDVLDEVGLLVPRKWLVSPGLC